MPPTAVETRQAGVWGRFDALRGHLYEQFQGIPFDPDTGLPPERLQQAVDDYLAEHPDMPRVLQRAHAYRLVVTRAQLCIDPQDWFVDKLNHGGILCRLREGWLHEAQRGPIREEAEWCDRALKLGLCRAGIDLGHISPGWQNMFRRGLTGLITEAEQSRAAHGRDLTASQAAFYEAVAIVYRATIALSQRFAALAASMASSHPEHRERLTAVAAVCAHVPEDRPRTFHEALQFAWLMHELIEMEGELVRSMGHFDRTYYPYYQADIEAGRLTREQAKELIKFFWIKWYSRTRGVQNGKNFLFGGQHADGSDVTNELTYVALEAYEELNAPDPKLSVRFFPGTPDRLYDRVPDLIRKGHNSFVLMNDVPAVEGVVRQGKSLADARTFLPIGCYEPAVDGKEAGCTMNIIVNLAKPIELALHDGIDPRSGQRVGPATGLPESFVNFEAFYAAYARQLDHIVERAVACTAVHEAQWPQINPSPLIAGTIDDCLARGKDIGEGGAHYNSVGCVGVGLANAADSLLSVKQVVFADHGMSLPEFVAMLDTDYAGREAERQLILKQVPKWGNGHPEADGLAKRVSETYCGRVNALVNGRGGPVQAALFSLNHRIHFGRDTGALPDGRRAGESLSPGVGPMPGMDRKGVTALLKSAGGLDYVATPNGAVLDVTLHPSAVRGREGLQAMVGLIKTFFSMGGYALQFNVCDAETLRAAQQEPEKYAGLQIRVTGWSAHFVTLPKDQQDHFIALTTHRV